MPRATTIDQRRLIELLGEPMTETARAEALGVARSAYYTALDRLIREGILRPQGSLNPGMSFNGAHPRSRRSSQHHAVLHVRWADEHGRWAVQGALLDEWGAGEGGDTSVTIRWDWLPVKTQFLSFLVRPISRWSTADTMLNIQWVVPELAIPSLTVAIARVINADALLIPETIDAHVATN